MNDITDKAADRFYKPLTEISGDYEVKTCQSFQKPEERKIFEFAPEPLHMNEAKVRGMKFTVGKKYPMLERKEEDVDAFGVHVTCREVYSFKTKDDNNKEIWVDEKYFIPSDTYLMGGFEKEESLFADQPDIRMMAKEKNVPELDVEGTEELQTLSGLKECEYDGKAYQSPHNTGWCYNNRWTNKSSSDVGSSIYEGVVKDTGNELMHDATKCMAAIDKVFGYNKVVDPDGIIVAISNYVPHLSLQWEDHLLTVNGAKTKISYSEIQTAYSGLKGLVSTKIAEKTVGKLVAGLLKKVF